MWGFASSHPRLFCKQPITGSPSTKHDEEAPLQRLFSTFPAGWPGLGLLLLRAAIGFAAVTEAAVYLATHAEAPVRIWVVGILAIASGVLLIVGFLTPISGAAIGLCILAVPFVHLNMVGVDPFESMRYTLLVLVADLAVVLLGPGALSADARLFGRREIVIARGPERP